ncbi:MAG: hypothetical protein ACXABY_14965, partial [Candidatus Thorarchaeota archaeon]
MAAVFDVEVDFGVTPTMESLTNLRFNEADDNVQDTSDPCVIPGAGTEYSYWKHVYLRCTTQPSVQCDNFKFYSDGSAMDTGTLIKIATNAVDNDTDYDQAAGTDEMVANHTGVTTSADVNNYTSGGSQLSITVVPGDNIIDATTEE